MIDFPDSPSVDDVFTYGSLSWTWDGTKWVSTPAGGAGGGITGPGSSVVDNIVVFDDTTGDIVADSGISITDVPSLGAINTFSKSQAVTPVTNASASGTVTPDANDANDFDYTLTGNLVIANPTNIRAGQTMNFRLTQDGTGSRTIGLGSYFKFAGGTTPTWSTGAGKSDFLSCRAITTTYLVCSAGIDIH